MNNDLFTWWSNLPDNWKDIFSINYVFQNRFSEQMRADILTTGVNPFQNYKYKLEKEFVRVDMDEKKLAKLKELTLLYMADCNISDLSPVAVFSDLRFIDGCFNSITTVAPLKGLTGLEYLFMEKNLLNSIHDLQNKKKLRQLVIRENKITDLKPLKNLLAIEFLDVSNNYIYDLHPLKGLKRLKELQVSLNNISDVSDLSDLNALEVLDLSSNKIEDVTPVLTLQKLRYLNLKFNEINYHLLPIAELESRSIDLEF